MIQCRHHNFSNEQNYSNYNPTRLRKSLEFRGRSKFQVITVFGYDEDKNEFDLTNKIDQGKNSLALEEVLR
jgi:hypothetical protein